MKIKAVKIRPGEIDKAGKSRPGIQRVKWFQTTVRVRLSCISCQQAFFYFLGANQDGALKTSFTLLPSEGGTKSLADNIDLIAGSEDKLTDLTRLLTYQHIAFVWNFLIETNTEMVTTRKGTLCTGDNSGGKTLDEMNNVQYISSN